ncbi:MAG TPA: response regulator, partial [Candidatus Bathyarchaeota archaeon]|nr:response regulator [Candidatus Bathyarchaeota archaeon]
MEQGMTIMGKKSILIVDDDRAILSSLEKILQLEGYSVDTAETGREAIEKAKNRFYNLMLLDIKLPDMEGTELLRAVDETEPKMVKIMVTGYPTLENAVKSLNLGADAYLM